MKKAGGKRAARGLANVDYAICDWKEDFGGNDYRRLKRCVPKGEFYHPSIGHIVDSKLIVRCPESMASWLNKHAIDIHDYGWDNDMPGEFGGLHWNGKRLFAIYNGALVAWPKWLKMIEANEKELYG